MKKLLFAFCCLLFAGHAPAQNLTSLFELKLYNTQNKLVTGKNVDLYQGAVKIYDLTESSSIPGVYVATIADGEYDIWVNASLWKSGIWIGANKVSLVTAMFSIDAGANNDTLVVDGHIQADTFSGDGSGLTGIVGSVASTTGDLILGADSDDNGSGDMRLQIGGSDRFRIYNAGRVYFSDTTLVVGNANLGFSATSASGLEAHEDTTVLVSVNRIYGGGTGSRHAMLLLDDFNDVVSLLSGKTGTVPNGNTGWPLRFVVGASLEVARMDLSGQFGLGIASAVSRFHLGQGANYTNAYGLKLTTTASGNALDDGVDLFLDSSNNAYLTNRESGYFSIFNNGSEKARFNPTGSTIIRDTTRVEKLRIGTAQTANYGLIVDANGNVATSALPMIGDTIEVSVFLDTTASNSGSGNAASLTRLGVRRSLTFWALDDTNSDTLLFSLPIPEYAESLEYLVLPYRTNTNSGNYFMSLSWEFFSDDDALDNSLTYTNNTTFTAPPSGTSGDWKLYRKTITPSATGSGRWMDGMIIRVGDNGSDTATGNMDLSTEIMLGWSRKRGY